MGQFKTATTKSINQIMDSPGAPVWQRNNYEHILRNEPEHQTIQNYRRMNPLNWHSAQDLPSNPPENEVPRAKQDVNV